MRIWLGAFVGLALTTAFAGVAGLTEPLPDADQRAREVLAAVEKNDLAAALRSIDAALAALPEPGLERGSFLRMRGAVLSDMGRHVEALPMLEQAVAMLPVDDADVRMMIASLQLAEGRAVEASRTIIHVSDRFPNQVADLNTIWVARLMRELDPKTEPDARFELALALTNRGFADLEEPGAMDWVRSEAILGLIRRDRADEARPLLEGFTDASSVIEMLVDKQYAPLWPAIEAAAGPRAARAIAADHAAAEAAHRRDPKNLQTMKNYVNALIAQRRAGEAAAISAPLIGDPSSIEAAGEDAFWLVNARAIALTEAGHLDAGDKLLADLLTLGVAKHHELISMAINRGGTLMDFDRPTEALAAAAFAEAQGEKASSDYGHMWSWQVEVCALAALDRSAEAKSALDRLRAKKAKNYQAYTLAMLCNGRLDEVEAVVLERLADPDHRSAMLVALQDFRPAASKIFRDRMRERLLQVRDRPAVRKAIAASGRILSIDGDASYWGSF